ncbi:MAG: DMT family transporter [Candidatus Nanoarchaeia archaeon]|nr:DMT family transporter [Candidatus Nanoarchaeia archaeon]
MKREYLFVIITGILSGFIVFGGQIFSNLGLSLFEISIIPQLVVFLLLIPFIILNKNLRVLKGKKWLWVLYGFATAGCVLSQFGGVVLGAPVAIVVLLLYTQPLWTMLITYLFLKEKITKWNILTCLLVIVGMIILINPFNVAEIKNLGGVIVSLFGGICLSGWVVIGSFVSKNQSPPITTKFTNAVLTIFFLLLAYPLISLIKIPSISSVSFNFSASIWIWIIIFALFTEIISHIFYFKGMKEVSTMDAGIILLLEPIVGSLLAVVFLGQLLTINIIIGGILILVANYLAIRYN